MFRKVTLGLALMAFSACTLMADDLDPMSFDNDLRNTPDNASYEDNQIPGDGLPLLEIDGKGGLFSDGAELYLTYHNEKKLLGALKRSGLRVTYLFTKEWPTKNNKQETIASVAPSVAGIHFKVFTGDRENEVGRVLQKFFSWGTGLNVYEKGEKKRIGYIDEKAAKTFWSAGTKRPYAFQSVDIEQKEVKKLFGGTKLVDEEVMNNMFWFVDKDFGNIGPAGVFTTVDKVPFLVVKGDWWMSEHIFDLFTTRSEAEGATGKILRGLGQLLADSPEEAKRLNDDANDVVLNPSAYLGVFLTSIIYIPEFRDAIGLELPIPSR
jgi:hypothetical protein